MIIIFAIQQVPKKYKKSRFRPHRISRGELLSHPTFVFRKWKLSNTLHYITTHFQKLNFI